MIRTTTMKRQHVLLNDMILLRSEKVFFLLSVSLSLSFTLCFQQNSSSSFYEVLCIKSETTFERRREKKGKILAKTLMYVRTKWCLSVQKILAKEYHKPTMLTEFLKPTETLLSSRIQKKQKPLIITRAKKWCVPSGGKSLLVL